MGCSVRTSPAPSPARRCPSGGCGMQGFGRAVCAGLADRIQMAGVSCVPFLAHSPRGRKKLNGRSRPTLAAVGAFGSKRELLRWYFPNGVLQSVWATGWGGGGGERHLQSQLDRELRGTCRVHQDTQAAVLAGVCPVARGWGRATTPACFPKPRPRAPRGQGHPGGATSALPPLSCRRVSLTSTLCFSLLPSCGCETASPPSLSLGASGKLQVF